MGVTKRWICICSTQIVVLPFLIYKKRTKKEEEKHFVIIIKTIFLFLFVCFFSNIFVKCFRLFGFWFRLCVCVCVCCVCVYTLFACRVSVRIFEKKKKIGETKRREKRKKIRIRRFFSTPARSSCAGERMQSPLFLDFQRERRDISNDEKYVCFFFHV